jgi:hypothetical protein
MSGDDYQTGTHACLSFSHICPVSWNEWFSNELLLFLSPLGPVLTQGTGAIPIDTRRLVITAAQDNTPAHTLGDSVKTHGIFPATHLLIAQLVNIYLRHSK